MHKDSLASASNTKNVLGILMQDAASCVVLISVLHTDADGAREVARRSSRWINDRRGAPDIYQRRTRKFIFSSEIVVSGFRPTTIEV